MACHITSLNAIPIKAESYSTLTTGWQTIGDHQAVDGFENMKTVKVGDKTVTIGCAYYDIESEKLCFIVKYREKWNPFKVFSMYKNKHLFNNINNVLSLSENCQLSFRMYQMKTVLVAEISDTNVLMALLNAVDEPLKKHHAQQTDLVPG